MTATRTVISVDAAVSLAPDPESDAGAAGPFELGDGGSAQKPKLVQELPCADTVPEVDRCNPTKTQSGGCLEFGFDQGVAWCLDDCSWDLSECSGTESCFDGRDNDGDGKVDCADVDDCGAACEDVCAVVESVEPGNYWGVLSGHNSDSSVSCVDAEEVTQTVFHYAAADEVTLDLILVSDVELTLAVRESCAEVKSESLCRDARTPLRTSLEVSAGQEMYLVIQGPPGGGDYELVLNERYATCGDGIVDKGESCDDDNDQDGDGCDQDCRVESGETADNNTEETATPLDMGGQLVAEIYPENDVDVFQVDVPMGASNLLLETGNLGDGACSLNLIDTRIMLVDSAGNLLASDDDSGDGRCARLSLGTPPAGRLFAFVSAQSGSASATFAYRFSVASSVCGDGVVEANEACDDMNLEAGDGCSSSCEWE